LKIGHVDCDTHTDTHTQQHNWPTSALVTFFFSYTHDVFSIHKGSGDGGGGSEFESIFTIKGGGQSELLYLCSSRYCCCLLEEREEEGIGMRVCSF